MANLTMGHGPVLRLAAAVLGALLLVLAAPRALLAGPYDVDGLAVQATDKDAVAAKAAAVADGQAQALRIVLQRLTRSADHARLPQVEPDRIEQLLANFSILSEQTGPTQYGASLSFRFEPAAVQNLFRQNSIPYTDTQAERILVVPVYRKGDQFFFTGDNPHLDAWRTFDLQNTLTPIVLPADDVSTHGIDPNAILARDADTLTALRYLYQVENVLIGLCEHGGAQGAFTCTLEGGGPLGPLTMSASFAADSDPLAAAQAAAGAFLARIEEQWKERNAVLQGAQGGLREGVPIPVRVSFSTLGEWQALRARLARVPGVNDIEIQALQARGALLSIYFSGLADQLAEILAREGMVLSNAGDHWTLTAN